MDKSSLLWAMRLPSMYGRERSPALYQHLLERAANRGSPRLCSVVAHMAFRWMRAETPLVQPKGEVLHALIRCIRAADPNAERTVSEAGPVVEAFGKLTPEQQNAVVDFLLTLRLPPPGNTSTTRPADSK